MRAGEALVIMGMAGKHRMRPYPGFFAGSVDLREHVDAPTMLAAGGISRVMMADDERAGEIVRLHPRQRRVQIIQL